MVFLSKHPLPGLALEQEGPSGSFDIMIVGPVAVCREFLPC